MSDLGEKVNKVITKISERFQAAKGDDATTSTSNAEKEYGSEKEAEEAFVDRSELLLSGRGWSQLSGTENASFFVYNFDGTEAKDDRLLVGRYLKIDLPGPLPMYWVKIEKVDQSGDLLEVWVRPSSDPTANPVNSAVTAHFFRRSTVNILSLTRKENKLIAQQKGIAEIANNEEPEAGGQATINTGVAAGGMAGVAQWQWNRFTNNLAGK